MTELSWPIERVERYGSVEGHWAVFFRDIEACIVVSTDELAATGIPAEPYPAPPVTITVTVGDRSEVVELTDEQAFAMIQMLHRLHPRQRTCRCVLLMRIDQLEQQLADLHTQRREHDKVVAWADDALARRDARITELIAERDAALAEVERLRALDQRTDPELARALNNLAATYDGSMYLVNAAADLRAAARLLGGDQ